MNRYLDAASEDSDSMRSRESSMDSDWQLNGAIAKIRKPCSKLSIEEEIELLEGSSLSSVDETDDKGLSTKQV